MDYAYCTSWVWVFKVDSGIKNRNVAFSDEPNGSFIKNEKKKRSKAWIAYILPTHSAP